MEESTGAAIAVTIVLVTVGIGAYAYFFWGIGVSPPSITTNSQTSAASSTTTTTSNCSTTTIILPETSMVTCITTTHTTVTKAFCPWPGVICLDVGGSVFAISGAGALVLGALVEGSSREKPKEFKGNLSDPPLQDASD